MFWKKKKPPTELLDHPSDNQRDAFRYAFRPDQQFSIRFKNKQVTVLNISAGGLAFKNQGFSPYDSDYVHFQLEIPNFLGDPSFSADLRILRIDENDVCHCIFEQCPLVHHELIHKYVLEMQKNDLAH